MSFLRASALILGTLLLAFIASVNIPALLPFSGFFAGVLKAGLAVFIFAAIDIYVFDEVDTVREIKAGNIAYAILLLALALLISASVATAAPRAEVSPAPAVLGSWEPPHVRAALSQVGVVERGANRGPQVEGYQRAVGIPPGSPWCAGFVRWAMDRGGVATPTVRSGAATAYLQTPGSVDARDVLRGTVRPEPGALVVWRRGSGWQGHIGILHVDDNAAVRGRAWYGRCAWSIEGNTSSGTAGSQRDGDGVYRRLRCIEPGSYFRIVGFAPVSYG